MAEPVRFARKARKRGYSSAKGHAPGRGSPAVFRQGRVHAPPSPSIIPIPQVTNDFGGLREVDSHLSPVGSARRIRDREDDPSKAEAPSEERDAQARRRAP